MPWLPKFRILMTLAIASISSVMAIPQVAAEGPDLIFRKSTVWKFLAPDHKLATYAIDDPDVTGVTCYYTMPEKGGWIGWTGLTEQLSNVSLSCRQVGPVAFKRKVSQAEDMFSQRRSLIFKKMQIVRACDAKRNVLVYMVYTDKLIEGSPENSTSSVPIMPWGNNASIAQCSDWIS